MRSERFKSIGSAKQPSQAHRAIGRLARGLVLIAAGIGLPPPHRVEAAVSPLMPAILESGGGEYVFRQNFDEIGEEQRRAIREAIAANIAHLEREGVLAPQSLVHPTFQWPLAPWNGNTDFASHGISNFVDQDPLFPNVLRDYNCGMRTYDTTTGYNHQGIDYFTWPFGWSKMDNNKVAVVAAAPGTIVFRSDGNFDRSCAVMGGDWNAIYVRHADNSIAWYGHMKNGSVTPKTVGETVGQGEYLGIVGSSGNSTGPHLHLEVYDSTGVLNEPYQGPCNAMNTDSWWANQRPYYDSAVNAITTGLAPPTFPACPNPEISNAQLNFAPGSTIYFTTYFRDQLASQISLHTIYYPDGYPATQWQTSSPAPHYAASYWWRSVTFPPGLPQGTYTFKVEFQGAVYTHQFNLGAPSPGGRVPGQQAGDLPLLVAPGPGGDITLSWDGSCSPTDIDYEVYEGPLGSFTAHAPVRCTTGGLTSASLTPGAGDRYYLVVPRTAFREGSYGRDSSGLERPASASACVPRLVGACP